MLISFEEMAKTARVWIYQADRSFTNQEAQLISDQTSQFLDQWAAHGQPLKASYKLLYHRFLIVAVDESYNLASGCSIDASVGLIKGLEKQFKISFFDRTKVAFLVDDQIFESRLTGLKELVASGQIAETTLTFNNLVSNVEQLEKNWIVQAGESWLKRYF